MVTKNNFNHDFLIKITICVIKIFKYFYAMLTFKGFRCDFSSSKCNKLISIFILIPTSQLFSFVISVILISKGNYSFVLLQII